MIDAREAARFIAALIPDEKDEPCFQTLDDCTVRKKRGEERGDLIRVCVGPLEKFVRLFNNLNTPARGAGIYLQISKGLRGAKFTGDPRAIFVDDDTQCVTEEQLSLCPPSIAVQTSEGKRHYYWLIKSGKPYDFRRAQNHLIAYFGTDKSIKNIDRVMRLPGSLNLKDPEKPFRVKLLSCVPERRYELADVLAAFQLTEEQLADSIRVDRIHMPEDDPAATEEEKEEGRQKFLKIIEWLDRRGIAYSIKECFPRKAVLEKCVFNPEHRNVMAIMAGHGGWMWAGCFHNSCGGGVQRWRQVAALIGEWDEKDRSFAIGDHTDLAHRALGDLRTGSPESCVYDGLLYRYSRETYLWEPIHEPVQERRVMAYSGYRKGRSGVICIDDKDARGVVRRMAAVAAQVEFFNKQPAGIMFKNGFLLATADGVKLVPPSPDHRQRIRLNFDWDANAACPRWLQFFDEVFRDDGDATAKREFLQEYIGAALLGVATRFQKMVFLVGEGANGKSVFINTASALFPDSLLLHIKPQDLGREDYRAQLVGVRLNTCTEIPEADIISSEAFKAVVDGSAISARNLYEKPFSFRPQAAHVFAANKMPGTQDYTDGFWRRLIIVTFNRKFDEREWDTQLETELTEKELQGICAWAVTGGVRLLQRKQYTIPPSHAEEREKIREQVDAVFAFYKRETHPGETPAAELYATFKDWLAANGYRTMTSATFFQRLKSLHIIPRRTKSCMLYPIATDWVDPSSVT